MLRIATVAVAGLILSRRAAADTGTEPPSSQPDATYGRIDGYVDLALGVGATLGPRAPRGTIDLRARYLETTGVFVTYEEGGALGSGAEPTRVLAAGLEIRPLFVARWLSGRELGRARADLLVDSLGLELGAFLSQAKGAAIEEEPGLQAGLQAEVPLGARASGPWIAIHGGLRWSESTLGGYPVRGPDDRAAYLCLTLAWHHVLADRAVDTATSTP